MLSISVTQEKRGFYAGDQATAIVQISVNNPQIAGPVWVERIEIQCIGFERVNSSWVNQKYKAVVQATDGRNKRYHRKIFSGQCCIPCGCDVSYGHPVSFRVWVDLPPHIPPTFKGQIVRYAYTLSASAQYIEPRTAPPPLPLPPSQAPPEGTALSSLCTTQAQAQLVVYTDVAKTWLPALLPGHAEVEGGEQADVAQQIVKQELAQLVTDRTVVVTYEALPPPLVTTQPQTPPQQHKIMSRKQSVSSMTQVYSNIQRAYHTPSPPGNQLTPGNQLKQESGEGEASKSPSTPQHQQVGQQTDQQTLERQGQDFKGKLQTVQHKSRTFSGSSETGALVGVTPKGRVAGVFVIVNQRKSYNLSLGQGVSVKFSLQPPGSSVIQLGGIFMGCFEFDYDQNVMKGNEQVCVKVSVTLHTEEILHPPYSKTTLPPGHTSTPFLTLYDMYEHLTQDTLFHTFIFNTPPPPLSPQSFCSSLLTVKWVLKFQFFVTKVGSGGGGLMQKRGSVLGVSPLEWSLPLLIEAPGERGA